MEKSFVNSKQIKVQGNSKIEAKKADIAKSMKGKSQKEIDDAVATSLTKDPILLNEKPNGVLLGICADPSLQRTKTDIIVSILDDGTEVAKISKNTLIDACAANAEADRLHGITYTVPLSSNAVMLEYRFQTRIDAIGDISGLSFYFKNQ